jgi:long-chain acyl-CoA synthetase
MCLTTSVLMGATTVLVPKFDLDLVFDAIRKFRPTIFPGVPTIYQQIAASPKARGAGLNTIRVCISGAMQLRRQTIDEFCQLTGAHVVQGYGMTETSPVTMANPLNGNARHVSIGLPVPGTQARIVSEIDPRVVMPVGEAGELVIRGPQVFRGYWNQPEETDRVLVDGWIRTGDIALMSPDGFFTLIDRKRDVIIVDGFNVYPSEVEEVLNTHPAVAESAVIGVPDSVHGERVHAYAVPRPGEAPEAAELIRFCAGRLTDYKIPDAIEIRAELPHNLLGKVLRRVLRYEHFAQTARESLRASEQATTREPVPQPGEPAEEPAVQSEVPVPRAEEPSPRADEPVTQAEEPVTQAEEPVTQADAKISG